MTRARSIHALYQKGKELDPRISSTRLRTQFGEFSFSCFSWGPHEEDNILCLSTDNLEEGHVLCRVQSACYTAEIFRSLDCDCHEQLENSLRRISCEGGVLLYMLCDGRGAGLYHKLLGLELSRTKGLDTADAYRELGLAHDPRNYERPAYVLRHMGVSAVRLLTNNPRKILGLQSFGFEVAREPLEIKATAESEPYLRAKRSKLGHLLTQFDQTNDH